MDGSNKRKKEELEEEGKGIPELVLECALSYINRACDRSMVSLVCRKWFSLDALTRKSVTVALCYAIDPSTLSRRFKRLEALKLKGKPRAAMFKLIPDNWGGFAQPWVKEMAVNCLCIKSVHFRRMIVTDGDLITLAKEKGHILQVLKLDKCSGFSTSGLVAITKSCRSLRVLFLDESTIEEHGGEWLHQIALHNSSLELLHFSATLLKNYDIADLEMIAAKCESLTSLKLSEADLVGLSEVLRRATALQELGGVLIGNNAVENNKAFVLPETLTSLTGLMYHDDDDGDAIVTPVVMPLAKKLARLDLQCAFLTVQGHAQLLNHCSNLRVLEVLSSVGDEGLEAVGRTCKNLCRLRVESGDIEMQPGFVTHMGLIYIAQGCPNLEYFAVYVSEINNAALFAIGNHCRKLTDFRLVLNDDDMGTFLIEAPLDMGVTALLQGCKLYRLGLYLRRDLLTDEGMGYIGRYGQHLKWVLFGQLGDCDKGLQLFASGCPNLERLEIRDCYFSEAVIAAAVARMDALKYVWVQGYRSTDVGRDLRILKDPFWNIEFIPEHMTNDELEEVSDYGHRDGKQPSQFLAYRSLAGPRTDLPDTIINIV